MRPTSLLLVVIAFVSGMILMADYVIANPTLQNVSKILTTWVVILTATAIGVGMITASRTHIGRIKRKTPGWYNSVLLLIGMVSVFLIGMILGTTSAPYQFIFNSVLVTSSATVYALLGFFVLSASYRAFSVRTKEAAAMMVATLITILGTLVIGEFLQIGPLSTWFFDVLSLGPNRALMVGVFIGAFAYMLRILFGRERRWIGETSEEATA